MRGSNVLRTLGAWAFVAVLLPAAVPAAGESLAYVASAAAGTVSVIDTRTNKVTSTFGAGEAPRAIAASVDGARIYVADRTGALIEHDVFEDKTSARMQVGGTAAAMQRSPRGRVLAVVLEDTAAIALVDMPTLRVKSIVRLAGTKPGHAAFSPDGQWLYAAAGDGDAVVVIDVAKGAAVASIRVGHAPRGIAFLPDGSRAYVAVGGTREIVAIDVARRAVVQRIRGAEAPDAIVAHPDGRRFFVGTVNAAKVHVLDTASGTFVAGIDVGAGPAGMALTPDGSRLYVACRGANEVTVVDASTYRIVDRLAVGAQPAAIAIGNRPNFPDDARSRTGT
jgi:YVTN family beta-propeller protein